MAVEEVRKRKGKVEEGINDILQKFTEDTNLIIEKITDEIINKIDEVRTNLSDEFYPDNLDVLENLREEITEIIKKELMLKMKNEGYTMHL